MSFKNLKNRELLMYRYHQNAHDYKLKSAAFIFMVFVVNLIMLMKFISEWQYFVE